MFSKEVTFSSGILEWIRSADVLLCSIWYYTLQYTRIICVHKKSIQLHFLRFLTMFQMFNSVLLIYNGDYLFLVFTIDGTGANR